MSGPRKGYFFSESRKTRKPKSSRSEFSKHQKLSNRGAEEKIAQGSSRRKSSINNPIANIRDRSIYMLAKESCLMRRALTNERSGKAKRTEQARKLALSSLKPGDSIPAELLPSPWPKAPLAVLYETNPELGHASVISQHISDANISCKGILPEVTEEYEVQLHWLRATVKSMDADISLALRLDPLYENHTTDEIDATCRQLAREPLETIAKDYRSTGAYCNGQIPEFEIDIDGTIGMVIVLEALKTPVESLDVWKPNRDLIVEIQRQGIRMHRTIFKSYMWRWREKVKLLQQEEFARLAEDREFLELLVNGVGD